MQNYFRLGHLSSIDKEEKSILDVDGIQKS